MAEHPFIMKFDRNLRIIYRNYCAIQSGGVPPVDMFLQEARLEQLLLTLRYNGDLQELEALGFRTRTRWSATLVDGFVRLSDLTAVASHPNTVTLAYGSEMKLHLDYSASNVHARGGPAAGVWTVDPVTGTFTGKATGKNVIIGILDTGIDWTHEVFLDASITAPTTRILRIWDQGLNPESGESSPSSPYNYGVEYKDSDINTYLQDTSSPKTAKKPRHRDCRGHGTHIASIAAGNGQAVDWGSKEKYEYVGIAPDAKIIVVKITDLESRTAHSQEDRVLDAVNYILSTARALTSLPQPAPVVINYSGGLSSSGPSDGLTGFDEKWANIVANLSGGQAIVASAGNEAGEGRHATIEMPPSGEIDIEVELSDMREDKTRYEACKLETNNSLVSINIWYPDTPGVTVQVKMCHGINFEPDPPLGIGTGSPFTYSMYELIHRSEVASTISGVGGWKRNSIELWVSTYGPSAGYPYGRILPGTYPIGIYSLRLKGPQGTKFHMWLEPTPVGGKYGFALKLPLPPTVTIKDECLISSPACVQGIIAVANYDVGTGVIDSSSSVGPLAYYSGTAPIVQKPDIAAPGQRTRSDGSIKGIRAARSGEFKFKLPRLPYRYIPMSGTSMSCPHVAGAIALIFEKKPNLTHTDIRNILQRNVQTPAPSATDIYGAGLLDANKAYDDA